jgi:ABC-type branched-subunit amino acid transport system substrate-binding protein
MNSRLFARLLSAGTIFAASISPLMATAQGVSSDTILIGQSAALSGPAEQLGKEMKLGAEAYFDVVNKSGGINGRKIKLISLDDGYEPERAKANTQKLIAENKVLALFGYVGTPTSNAALPVFTEAKVPFVGAFTGAQSLREPYNRYIFNVRASYFDETEEIVRHLVQQGVTKIAVFYQNDGYGQAGLAGVERALKKRNMQIAAKATVERNTVDVSKAVKDLSKSGVAAVILVSAYKSCAAFIREMQLAGAFPQFWNLSFVGSKALAAELGDEARGVQISQVVPFPWSDSVPVVREYQKRIGGEANYSFTSLEGYIAAKVLVEGLKKAGKNLNRESLAEAMSNMGTVDVGGFKVTYSHDNHLGSSFVDLTIITRGGKFMR